MAAIFGIVGEANETELIAMSDRLQHRGYFGHTARVASDCWFGVRSNSAAAGMLQMDGLTLVTDATLYDTERLRSQLTAGGHRFLGDTEEELILAAYRHLGLDGFRHLHGDFAVAIWDQEHHTLALARDAIGTRPLHYWHRQGEVVFASEYKALLATDRVPATLDLDALAHLHQTKYLPPNQTLLSGIVAVPPGQFLVFRSDGPHPKRFWNHPIDVQPRSEEEHARRIRAELRQAVARRVAGLDEVGINLSSGIDSTAILGTLRNAFPSMPVHSFTAGYGEDDPEMRGAALVADHCGTVHHPVVVPPDRIPEILPSIVWHLEDPIARSEVVLNFEVAREAARFVPVVLGGYGGDTVFAGMPKHKIFKLMQWLPPLKSPLSEFFDYTQTSRTPGTLLGKGLTAAYFRGREPRPLSINNSDWRPARSTFKTDQPEFINRFLLQSLANGYRSIPKIERLHSAQGVEVRYPFLDPNVIASGFEIAERFKIRRWTEKYILRKAVNDLLPKAAVETPKFPSQMKSDLLFSETLEMYARTILTPSSIQERGFFRIGEVDRLLRRSLNKPYTYGHAMRIWTAVMTELWARSYLDLRGAPHVPVVLPTGPAVMPVHVSA